MMFEDRVIWECRTFWEDKWEKEENWLKWIIYLIGLKCIYLLWWNSKHKTLIIEY